MSTKAKTANTRNS